MSNDEEYLSDTLAEIISLNYETEEAKLHCDFERSRELLRQANQLLQELEKEQLIRISENPIETELANIE